MSNFEIFFPAIVTIFMIIMDAVIGGSAGEKEKERKDTYSPLKETKGRW